jgi:hypothetical protein
MIADSGKGGNKEVETAFEKERRQKEPRYSRSTAVDRDSAALLGNQSVKDVSEHSVNDVVELYT